VGQVTEACYLLFKTPTFAQNLQLHSVEWLNDELVLNSGGCVWKWSWPDDTVPTFYGRTE
jgi:hypothetical protein